MSPRLQTRGIRLEQPEQPSAVTTFAPADLPAGEVRVAVRAAGVNRSDLLNVAGLLPITTWPRVPGRDFAGVVVDGPEELVGLEVWGAGGGDLGFSRDGSHADHVHLPAAALVLKPERLGFDEAAACGLPFLTAALALLRLTRVRAGDVVLVAGAAGGVGSAALELARWQGARVVALVKDAEEAASVRGRGFGDVVNGSAEDASAALGAIVEAGADIAVDCVGPPVFDVLTAALGPGGRLVAMTSPPSAPVVLDLGRLYRMHQQVIGLSTVAFDVVAAAELLRELLPGLESGALRPPAIGARFGLEAVAEGYAAAASGTVAGRILLTP